MPVAPVIDPGAPWEYRARAQFKVIGGNTYVTDPGMAAIWRFEKAFYFDRDPVAARAAATPDAV